ncbi:MAG: ABC transporter substrate-binding protein [Alphaproteobacteria bacterium]|jgi:NitT/TauT family transport system substrate-binding protein|nr:ABC transporter substrate-binding protein [Alphaproteobacteria bacterium]
MTITLFENHRAVFYTPFYAAYALGAYRAEGVEVRLETSSDPPAATRALLAGEADVSWGGPMRILLTYDQDPDCGLVAFAEAVTRDPFFLIGSEPRPEFALDDLQGLRLATVAEVPTPWLCLQDDMRRAGLDPAALDRVDDQGMAENAEALRAGRFDVVQVYEPHAERLLADGAGHIWYTAAERGATAYTTLFTTTATLADKPAVLAAMTRALYRMQKWLDAASPETIRTTIADFFPDLEPAILGGAIARYKEIGVWGRNPILPRDGFERLKAACLSGGLIARGTDYEACVDTGLAEAAIATDPPAM